ncbi:hypothetical protein NEHOM01_0638 [Nematocida homosporus]|uniref:uncharacterized protein n=1 Tax=Nematocida homosporus TaxID=1912981 RepID=UPI0022208624|nr:uncharacterized protein NEHOM01_0638 [Nematocida homosporus]KAI5185133.1 hypothetical protein NEHOM01_0638 [Nematocida homosporus]
MAIGQSMVLNKSLLWYLFIIWSFIGLLIAVPGVIQEEESNLWNVLHKTAISKCTPVMDSKRMTYEDQDDLITRWFCSEELWSALSGRPVFGGQLFSHLIHCALKKYPTYTVFSSNCTFYLETKPDKKIVYEIETENRAGKQMIELGITGKQESENNEYQVTIRGTVLLHTGTKFTDLITKPATDHLEKYCKDNKNNGTSSSDQIANPSTTTHKQVSNLIDLFDTPEVYAANKGMTPSTIRSQMCRFYAEKCVRLKGLSDDPWSRCILFDFSRQPRNQFFQSDSSLAKILLLAFLSDDHILETAIISQNEDITSKIYNILTITHSIQFANLDAFEIHTPFFYSITVNHVINNMAYCTGQIIQNNQVIAYVCQNGAIRSRQKTAK